jgi:hypothetical protein
LTAERNGFERENASQKHTIADLCAHAGHGEAPTTLIARASVNHARRFGSQCGLAAPRARRFTSHFPFRSSVVSATAPHWIPDLARASPDWIGSGRDGLLAECRGSL